jgi:hypothetical protein
VLGVSCWKTDLEVMEVLQGNLKDQEGHPETERAERPDREERTCQVDFGGATVVAVGW